MIKVLLLLIILIASLTLIFKLLSSYTQKKLSETIADTFKKEDILGISMHARLLAEKTQARGYCALVLTEKALTCIFPLEGKYTLLCENITEVSIAKSFLSRVYFNDTLIIKFVQDEKEDSIRIKVANTKEWSTSIEALQTKV